jgi:glycosyltransferase involved in cell wall biosynthesis
MKIAFLVTRADPIGGAQIHVRDLAAELRRQGHSPTVLLSGSGPFIDDLRARGIPVIVLRHLVNPIRPYRDVLALREIVRTINELKPDLMTAHGAKVGILGRLAARHLQLPLVVTVHGWACAPGTPRVQAAVSRGLERTIGALASKVITVSEFDRQFGLRSKLVTDRRVVTVHNGMPDIPAALQADPSRAPVKLIMIARFEPQKDHGTLLHALGGLRHHQWELDIVGDGPLRQDMEALASSLSIRERVHFLGQRSDVDHLLAKAQISVLASNWEGFPLSILEAMRAGLPIVASNVGGVAEAVEENQTGYVVPRGDVESFRARVADLLDSAALRSRLGAAGRRRYEEQFTLGRLVEKTLAVYGDVLGRKGIRTSPSRDLADGSGRIEPSGADLHAPS